MQVNVNNHVCNLNSCEDKASQKKVRPQRDLNHELCKVHGSYSRCEFVHLPLDCHYFESRPGLVFTAALVSVHIAAMIIHVLTTLGSFS